MSVKVLIACEESQVVCIEFRKLGFEAFSCDTQECSGGHPEWHIKGDAIKEAYSGKYKIMIGFPPCTFLSYAATSSWNNPGRLEKRLEALEFFAKLWLAPIDMICLENPKGCASPTIAKYNQIIQPYYFGDDKMKTTCLWLKNLPTLVHVKENNLFEVKTAVNRPPPIKFDNTKRKKARHHTDILRNPKERSKTFPGIAKAMAEQWSKLL